jgi:DMSO/TMAO reductase YedYZ molybdopterin-dependent catalytic subunit
MDQYTESLPIACVEGWSTTQDWTGVRISDLAALAGIEGDSEVTVQSLEQGGSFNQATLAAGQVANERSLLALKVNGEDLSLDHGYPARVIVPALPGVHCTKWVSSMTFTQA